jgi:hypothetical protein
MDKAVEIRRVISPHRRNRASFFITLLSSCFSTVYCRPSKMDPLSVMASVVGLLTAAANVSSMLSAIKSSVKDAPQLLNYVLSEVKEVEISLSAIHKFLQGVASAPRQRIALIQLDQLIATLTEAVLTFSELEALVTPLAMQSKVPTMERVKWALKEETVSSIMQRLQRHKSSLSLMLNIVQWLVFALILVPPR